MGYRVSRLLVAVCLSLAVVLAGVALPAAAAPFSDVPASDPAYTAITELAARGIIKGCDQAAGRFCPNEPTLRAQMAALIARAMQWDGEDHGTQFADRCDPAQGCIDNDLWRNVGTLQFYGVAKGFDATSYGPHVNVAQQQVILFISRAMVKQGSWQRQPDNAGVYPNLPRGSAAERLDAQDVVTYVHYVGAAPDTQSSTAWGSYAQASTRAWFARALWQVLARFPVGPAPSTPPGNAPALSISPASGPAGTRFVVTGVGAPAGAAIGWVFSYGGVGANSGSFVLDPGMTAFTFTVASDSDPAGAWALSFNANGQPFGTVFYTITSAPASSQAAQFKAQMVAAVDLAYPSLANVLNQCPYTGSIQCSRLYGQAQDALNAFSNTLFTIHAPTQCTNLALQIAKALSEAQAWMGNDVAQGPYGVNTNDAANRAFEAMKWLQAIRTTVLNTPGTCR